VSRFDKVGEYLNFIQDRYNIHICIKDFCGFIPINKELDGVMRPFLAHTNPFCMYIKQDKDKYFDCLSMIRKMYNKCDRLKSNCFGMCHAGLGEYVVPISDGETLFGSINIGFFPVGKERSSYRIKKVCQSSEILDTDTALKLYNKHIRVPTISPDELLPMIEVVAEYLALTYANVQATHSVSQIGKKHYNSSEDTVISHAIEYIRQNYNTKIGVSEIAEFCHCSESYISHIFKRRTGVNINTYINKTRVEFSKHYLITTNDSMSDISINIGFNDPNYFSRVFTELIGCPPSEFRRRFR
jgi:AraC-type DNA-binding domain-containing proteins